MCKMLSYNIRAVFRAFIYVSWILSDVNFEISSTWLLYLLDLVAAAQFPYKSFLDAFMYVL